MLRLKDISVKVGKGTPLERTILRDLNLHTNKGEFITIVGGNGAGKSTLFKVISGQLKPKQGSISVDKKDVTKVLQDPKCGTIEGMSIFENMAFAYNRRKKYGFKISKTKSREKYFKDSLSILGLGLEDRLEEPVRNLSGGQRQALSLVMAILRDYKVLLLDEITASLDPKSAKKVMGMAAKLSTSGNHTTLMITHSMEDALRYGDRTFLLKNGQLTEVDKSLSPSELFNLI